MKPKGFMRAFLSGMFIFLAPTLLFALNGSIRGSVVDGKTGETLPGVTIYVEGTTLGTITDFDGKFNIQVDPGKYDLRVSFKVRLLESAVLMSTPALPDPSGSLAKGSPASTSRNSPLPSM